jgi:hypothetical protein
MNQYITARRIRQPAFIPTEIRLIPIPNMNASLRWSFSQQRLVFPLGKTKSLTRPWDSNGFESHANTLSLSAQNSAAIPRFGSWFCIENPSPLWTRKYFTLVLFTGLGVVSSIAFCDIF